jgi:DNA invertase Pin-like site-specific DNA recombinase
MPHKRYFSYVRVSTQRQGQSGTSLAEQQSAIERYARNWNLEITKRFEERETAAKAGRPVFLGMLKELRRGKADGVVIHKVDRGARNLKDWADLGSLIDSGVEVLFAGESLDLNSRGGRLSADIQAVVASDFIRNLREETKKGIYGRLKQGLYPFPAVIGYLDCGKGNPKQIDPVQAPLIRETFELYASGEYGLIALAEKMYESGLRNKKDKKVTINGLSTILHNPFYTGLIRIEKTGELFAGRHEPVVSKKLFDEVQAVFRGKNIKKSVKHFFIFRRHVFCDNCNNLFIAERHKDYIYYRCHTKNCCEATVREELIEKTFLGVLRKLQFNEFENEVLSSEIIKQDKDFFTELEARRKSLSLRQGQIKERLSRLADGFMDGIFDQEIYLEKKNDLVVEQQDIKQKLGNLMQDSGEAFKRIVAFLELANSAQLSYKIGKPEERRDLVKTLSSNFSVRQKKVLIKLNLPFQMIAERPSFTAGSPKREAARTFSKLVKKLFVYFRNLDTSKGDNGFINYLNSKQEKITDYNSLKLNN